MFILFLADWRRVDLQSEVDLLEMMEIMRNLRRFWLTAVGVFSIFPK
jgi:hypothetical protein